MGDLISRQAAIEALERDEEYNADIPNRADGVRDAIITISSLSSAEPEIIRCKDCKYAHLTYSGDCKFCDKWTDEFGIPEEVYLDGAFFCGYAKRREDE